MAGGFLWFGGGALRIVLGMPNPNVVERIRKALERNVRAVTRRPAIGQVTVKTLVRVVDGLRCEVQEGRWTITADASDKSGGTGAGPDPSALSRAALGSCLAMGYVMWAARMQVPLESVEVELQSDFDARGQYGVPDVRPGHSEVRYHVRIVSPAPQDAVRAVVDRSDATSMVLDAFSNPQTLVRQLDIRTPE
jgi:uncharacterized OsmC-like protein